MYLTYFESQNKNLEWRATNIDYLLENINQRVSILSTLENGIYDLFLPAKRANINTKSLFLKKQFVFMFRYRTKSYTLSLPLFSTSSYFVVKSASYKLSSLNLFTKWHFQCYSDLI